MGEQWHTVERGSKKCAKWKHSEVKLPPIERHSCISIDAVKSVKERLGKSELWKSLQNKFKSCPVLNSSNSIPWLICLGIGSGEIGDRQIFAAQLGLALLIRDQWDIPRDRTWVSDPVMSNNDCALLRALNLTPDLSLCTPPPNIPSNASFISLSPSLKSDVIGPSSPVILFMPHCDKPIYGECLRLIDSLSALNHCVLIGNDLSQYDNFQAKRFYQDNPTSNDSSSAASNSSNVTSCILASEFLDKHLDRFESLTMDVTYCECPRAFNNLCLSFMRQVDH